ncbi:hypothetical protein H920_01517 [Fukomys damarensis]|uniref:Uncharacterized protein n=1 Tax=Fukomys damarensis TaxID=885580 RepID=A0A091EN27_FUKDA|nr:hypothetical protein H920_01517 [Fukomys damarensis]
MEYLSHIHDRVCVVVHGSCTTRTHTEVDFANLSSDAQANQVDELNHQRMGTGPIAGLGRKQFSGDSTSRLLYESARQGEGELQSQPLRFSARAEITSLALCHRRSVGCSSSWGQSRVLSSFGNALYHTA